jgi:RDD family
VLCWNEEPWEGLHVIGHRLERYPFPIAYPARLLEIADSPADQLDRAGHFVELTAVTLGVLALAWCRAQSQSLDVVDKWEKKLDPFGIALGTWIDVIKSASSSMAGRPNDPLARAVRLSSDAAVRGLETYQPTRNMYAHGGKPRLLLDQQAAVSELDDGVSAILDGIEPLTGIQLSLIRNCQPSGSSHMADLEVLAGSAEPFPTRRIRCHVAFDPGTVVASHQGGLESAVDLTPFCVWRPCPVCHRDELFYLHQRRRQRSFYLSFSTGHRQTVRGDTAERAPRQVTTLRMEPRGAARSATASGWRAAWADLASRPRRLAARLVDVSLTAALVGVAWLATAAAGLPVLATVAVALVLGLAYEPVTAMTGGTHGKRLLRIEPVSIWGSRPLGRADTLRRALSADLQILFPPVAVRNLAWLLWDPARQCLHDRLMSCIVIGGRSRSGRKA